MYWQIRLKNLLCANTMVEKANQKLVPTWYRKGPRKSSFIRCSRTQTTKPMNMKKHPVVNQRSQVNGSKNTQAFLLLLSLIGTSMDTPDSVYGNVKSTYKDLFAVIVISPTAASQFCQVQQESISVRNSNNFLDQVIPNTVRAPKIYI